MGNSPLVSQGLHCLSPAEETPILLFLLKRRNWVWTESHYVCLSDYNHMAYKLIIIIILCLCMLWPMIILPNRSQLFAQFIENLIK